MTNKNKPTPRDKQDEMDYNTLGIVFMPIGLALTLSDAARPAGITFLILCVTFFLISAHTSAKKKKNKK